MEASFFFGYSVNADYKSMKEGRYWFQHLRLAQKPYPNKQKPGNSRVCFFNPEEDFSPDVPSSVGSSC